MKIYEQLKTSISLPQMARRYGIKTNASGMTNCLFHDDTHPSMKLNDTYFYCFGCGALGDVIDFTAKLHELSPHAAAQKLQKDFCIDPTQVHLPIVTKTESDRVRERLCFSYLSEYYQLLQQWKVQYAPASPTEPIDDRYVESCQMIECIGFYLDVLTTGTMPERKQVLEAVTKDGRMDHIRQKCKEAKANVCA